MIKYINLLIVSGENKVLIRKHRFGNVWKFIEKKISIEQSGSEIAHLYALRNFKLINIDSVFRLGTQEYEETGDIEECWVIKLRHAMKTPISLLYKYYWIDKEEAKTRTRNYEADVFYYIQKYFKLC